MYCAIKNDFWSYEEEVRVFIDTGNYINVDVKEVIFGEKVDRARKSLLKKIIKNLDYKLDVIEKGME
ncbi:hypothetical protein [Aliikangiella sp. G2MR2-5]|uniref:hypothetical protein n=1 Tax=Aliikangiella sp. G2MR2-5 TaxID=2788943 RepID=UPI0018ABBF3D|nr:hypothetical protein [Aliikangiella sp. G2MR2-5]